MPFHASNRSRTRAGDLVLLALLASCSTNVSSVDDPNNGGRGRVVKDGHPQAMDASPDGVGGQGGTGGASMVGMACGQCEMQQCSSQAFVDMTGADYYKACYSAMGNATKGPAAGLPRAQLCKAVIDCAHNTGCAVDRSGRWTGDSCYCGAGVDLTFCISGPQGSHAMGPCKDAIEAAAESVDPTEIAMDELDPSSAVGAALGLIYFCDTTDGISPTATLADSPCAKVCAGLVAAGGTSGSAGSGGGSDGGIEAAGGMSGSGGASGGGAAGTGASGGSGGGGAGGTASGGLTISPECRSCELDPSGPLTGDTQACNLYFLTAQEDANQLPIAGTFGCETLDTPAARAACSALLACIIARKCSSNSTGTGPGDNPSVGCFCGTVKPSDCISAKEPLDGACLAEYEAAASATPGGPTPGSDVAKFAGFISPLAFEPTTPFGLAANIVTCAIDSPCASCMTLVPTSGSGGASGGAGGPGRGGTGGGTTGSGGSVGMGGAIGTGIGGSGVAGHGGASGASGQGGVSGASGGTGRAGAGGSGAAGTGGAAAGGGGGTGGCPDLNNDGVADCQQTVVANAGFDQSAADWSAETDAIVTWMSADARGSSRSGSLEVDNRDMGSTSPSGFVSAGAWQCIPVTAGSRYQTAVQAYVPSGQGGGWAGFVLRSYFASDCTGPNSGRDFVSPSTTLTDAWQTISGSTTQVPLGITSVAVRLIAAKPVAQASLRVQFDNVLVVAE